MRRRSRHAACQLPGSQLSCSAVRSHKQTLCLPHTFCHTLSPIWTGICVLTHILKVRQCQRDTSTFTRKKMSDKNPHASNQKTHATPFFSSGKERPLRVMAWLKRKRTVVTSKLMQSLEEWETSQLAVIISSTPAINTCNERGVNKSTEE